ncbi:MAG: agmatine deiminase [Beduini sp.]|uniref:agmatine deiminase n=1 Tax=Beduini sp. TaxID=1922300 RepID=UPI0011C74516
MKILRSTPKQDGFYMPAEFEKHDGCFMIWPERADSWQFGAIKARQAFVEVASAIGKFEKLIMCASHKQYNNAREMLPDYVRVVEMSSDDAWARDVGPTFVRNKEGTVRGIDWYFNAWGGLEDGLYFPWDKDNQMAKKMCDLLDKDIYDAQDFVLEGGSIHVDGEGTAIVTEACLLSKGRNPDLSKEEITQKLKDYLNVEKVIWLKSGIYNDETNEHVDNICAYIRPGEVVLAWCEDKNDPQYALSKSCLDILNNETDAQGRKIIVHKIPMPSPILITQEECNGLDHMNFEPTRTQGERLAGSYVNFYIANQQIIMPGFNDPMDKEAKALLQQLFPDREVIQIYARDILIGGGNIHCITQQIPKGGL